MPPRPPVCRYWSHKHDLVQVVKTTCGSMEKKIKDKLIQQTATIFLIHKGTFVSASDHLQVLRSSVHSVQTQRDKTPEITCTKEKSLTVFWIHKPVFLTQLRSQCGWAFCMHQYISITRPLLHMNAHNILRITMKMKSQKGIIKGTRCLVASASCKDLQTPDQNLILHNNNVKANPIIATV